MKYLFLSIIIIIFVSCGKSQSQTDPITTKYYLIRHAEKDKSDKTNRDPRLIAKGQERAQKWAKYFDSIKLNAVYSTNYLRTRNTAKPTADSKNLQTILYNPKTINYKEFLSKTKGQAVLIVGHSNSTPSFVNKLIGEEKYESIDETINSKLFVVNINSNNITSKIIDVD